jgi:hypothetical protein
MISAVEANEAIKTIYRQAERYQLGAEQDNNPIIAFLHNSYAAALTDVLREISDNDGINAATGGDYQALRRRVLSLQDALQGFGMELWEELQAQGLEEELTKAYEGSLKRRGQTPLERDLLMFTGIMGRYR